MKIASRMNSIPFSGIRKVFEEVIRREKMGEKIIHLEIGRRILIRPITSKRLLREPSMKGKCINYSYQPGSLDQEGENRGNPISGKGRVPT